MAQQPLSAAIRNLESELGFELFERVANRIRLSSAGRTFLGEARGLLAAAERAVERGRRASRGEIGTLRIGYCSAATESVLPPAIAAFRAQFKGIAIDLQALDQTEQLAALDRGELDLVFIHRPFDERDRSSVDVLEERLFVALPEGHELARRKTLEPRCLVGVPLVRFAPPFRAVFPAAADALFSRLEIVPNYVEKVADHETGMVFVAAGIACFIVPESRARGVRLGVSFVPLDSDLRIRLAAVWNRSADEHLLRRRFVDLITAPDPKRSTRSGLLGTDGTHVSPAAV